MLMLKIGIVMLIVVVGGFVIMMVVPDAMTPLGPLFCQSGEHFINEQSTFSIPGETSTSNNYSCVNSDGQKRDINDQVMGPVIGGYLVLLFTSVILMIVGASRSSAKNDKQTTSTLASPRLSTPSGTRVSIGSTTDQGAMLEDMVSGLESGVLRFGGKEIPLSELKSGNYQHVVTANSKHTLAETLKQLKEARDQSLITDDEYQHLRQEALDKLV